ncbi:MAG TPA: glycoside hydrolase family 3 N-terminal domain-containing protein [Dissulfurispiraceae bacterium]|nr:glycoside hydrolase family 3 N-terminal domain-containing protein [Dissulfurispiraceae bacterium]
MHAETYLLNSTMQTTISANDMPLNKRLYQLIISRIDGEKLTEAAYVQAQLELVQKGIGGFIIFGGPRDIITNAIHDLQTAAEVPLFIASDIERGVAQQIQGGTPFPSQMAVAAAIDMQRHEDRYLLSDALNALAAEAADIGINMPLLPVLDVNRDPDNPIICTRAFSDDPAAVAALGSHYIRTLQSCGMLTCAKHFPGHGDTSADSHIELPVILKSRSEIIGCDISPYDEAIKAGVKSIMIGHLLVPELDDRPASISRKIVTDLLRTELGFDGLIMTDALNMHALAGIEQLPVACMQAGVDILLHPIDADAAVADLETAIGQGELKPSIIDIAVERILRTKNDLGGASARKTGHPGAVAARLAGKSITLVDHRLGILPLYDPENTRLVLCGDIGKHDVSPVSCAFPHHISIDDAASGCDHAVLFAIFTSVAAWRGSSGIAPEEVERIQAAMQKVKQSIAISFGSPYVLRHFSGADALIAAYDASRFAQGAVIGCLGGAFGFNGRLPVRIPFGDVRAD